MPSRKVTPIAKVAADFDLGRLFDALNPRPAREWRVPVRRPDDMLVFDLLFDNLELKKGDRGPRLERRVVGPPAVLVIELPPQSFGEEAFQVAESDSEPPPNFKETVPPLPSARIRMSGPSRLAFVMPEGQDSLDYTLLRSSRRCAPGRCSSPRPRCPTPTSRCAIVHLPNGRVVSFRRKLAGIVHRRAFGQRRPVPLGQRL
jgi:hypothetical protein